MLKVTEIVFCGYAVTDFARARRFYEGVLGLKPTKVKDFPPDSHWAEYDIGPGTLSLGSAPAGNPAPTAAPWRWKWKISTRPSRICARTA